MTHLHDIADRPLALDPDTVEPGATLTPSGLQDKRSLAQRRVAIFTLTGLSVAVLAAGIYGVFAPGGLTVADWIILAAFLIGAPWIVMALWNAIIGLVLMHTRRDTLALVAPHLEAGDTDAPIRSRVALTMCLRNEPPLRSLERMAALRRALDDTPYGRQFDIFLLSDTSEADIAAEEDRLFAEMRPALGGLRASYRRREKNTGYKAGNVREFLTTQGKGYELYIPLDSDSYMGADTILRMVRIMEAHPAIGILQSLCTGMASRSLFNRAVTFAARISTPAYLMGATWWQGDTCYYWGHNAVIRTAPFRNRCRLPVLPGQPPLGGHILSHDLAEAALMRRAGYECRVIPVEMESYEENPPTLLDFIRRDLRWCNGNMQVTRLTWLRGLTPLSRFHLASASLMYFSAPAWMLMTAAAASKLVVPDTGVDAGLGIVMFFGMMMISLAPKLVGIVDVLLTRGGLRRFGGGLRFFASAVTDILISMLMAPVVAFRVTLFLIGLAFGKRLNWTGQNRDVYRVEWGQALSALWPVTLAGIAFGVAIVVFAGWGMLVWAAPMVAGLGFAVPFTILTASPAIGRIVTWLGLCRIPDETQPTPSLRRLSSAGDPAQPAQAA
ncbi:MAG: glucans biosynthesis glucosyltransferase MdoH [Paracoccaceae bacterium]